MTTLVSVPGEDTGYHSAFVVQMPRFCSRLMKSPFFVEVDGQALDVTETIVQLAALIVVPVMSHACVAAGKTVPKYHVQ